MATCWVRSRCCPSDPGHSGRRCWQARLQCWVEALDAARLPAEAAGIARSPQRSAAGAVLPGEMASPRAGYRDPTTGAAWSGRARRPAWLQHGESRVRDRSRDRRAVLRLKTTPIRLSRRLAWARVRRLARASTEP
ncbi:hypothetical protein EFP18_12815 [Burkholderia glumae]|nr:H-NS family nucleoid-associated regulatory protein [Burkholderia glumae]MCQ0033383.1 H-NS histone family protein [Burkholderia glumae]MCQ0036348.1 H-NS histone family protein [Burkholderia glumae]MCR1768976.1 H-NS histone family protein [Burkholderia glumae]QHP89594.1 hypothetical protein EXE55_00590 [Burkholderia glumae]QJW77369.1 H-NS histone family protein [Burkholderia glumae]